MHPTLTVATATTRGRVDRVTLPSPAEGVDHLVTVQGAEPELDLNSALPAAMGARPDVTVRAVPGAGLSRNRNAGLSQAAGTLVLFSDDDIQLCPAGIEAMRAAFAADPGLDLALGWRAGTRPDRGPRSRSHRLTRLNAGHACAPEIVVRREAVRARGLLFDPRFGISGAFPSGEDYVFVADLLAAGLRGRGVPIVMGRHDGPSTGDAWDDLGLLAARRAVLARVFGAWNLPVAVAYGWRHRARLGARAGWLRFALRTPPRLPPR